LLQWVSAVDEKWPGLIDSVLSFTGAMLALGAAIAILTPVFSALGAAIGLLFSPIVLLASLFAAAAWHIWSSWDRLGPEMAKIFSGLGEAAAGLVELLAGVFTGDLERIKSGWNQMWSGLSKTVEGSWEVIKSLVSAGLNTIDSAIRVTAQTIDAMLGTDLAGAYERMKTSASDAWTSISQSATDAWTSVSQSAGDAWDGIKGKADEFVNWAREIPGRIAETIGDLPGKLKQAGIDAIQALWDGMVGKFDEMIGALKAKWEALTSLFKFSGGGPAAPAGAGTPDTMHGFSPTSAPGGTGNGIGGSAGFSRASPGQAANSNVQVGGRIVVEAAEGSRVVNVQSANPAVPVTPDRGTMVGRA